MSIANGCDTCNKSTLSLLLLRPSPIAKAGQLVPPGAARVVSDDALTGGLLPERLPTESRFALRLLRAGYVHVYIPAPPPSMKHWQVYRVTDQADLVSQDSVWFKQPTVSIACPRPDHNAMGLKLLHLPQAHKIKEIWIAYSANLWNDTLRAKNQANPKVMQHVILTGSSPNTFKPTADMLKSRVLECALTQLTVDKAADHDFPFVSVARQVDNLAANLEKAAACHPKTKGHELAVVLRDPVGIATELNELRLRRHELAKQEAEKPENAHPLNSSNALMGLKKVMLDANLARSFDTISPVMSEGAFRDIMRTKPNARGWPADTQWVPLESTADNRMRYGPHMGRVIFPDHKRRAYEWADKQTAATWHKMTDRYDDAKRMQWIADFEARMIDRHIKPLTRYETDWRAVAEDIHTHAYFKNHFDPNDPNDPHQHHSPGTVYSRESSLIHSPAPFTGGTLQDAYLVMMDKPIIADDAVVLRALVGNQQAVIDIVHTQLTGAPGTDGMRDKTYDFLKGLSSESHALKKYSWLGDALAMFSVGQLAALSGAALSAAGRSQIIAPRLIQTLNKLQHLWGLQQAVDLSMQAALNGQAPRIPVLISMKVEVDEALAVLRARNSQGLGVTRSQIKRMRRSVAKISLSLLTDTEQLKVAQGDVRAVLHNPNVGDVGLKGKAAAMATAGSAVILTEEKFLDLYARQSRLSGVDASAALRRIFVNRSADMRAITMTLDGRLAIGSLIVQGIGLLNGVHSLAGAKSAQEIRDAWYGLYDSAGGMLAGILEMWAVAASSRAIMQGGEALAQRSMGLAALKFAGSIVGVAGGVINAVAAWAKAEDASISGEKSIARAQYSAAAMFTGMALTSTIVATGVAADWIIARQVGNVVVRQIAIGVAERVGAEAALTVVFGTTITVSGIGLVLLGAGMICQVGAVLLTPTPLQKWISRSYFGTGNDKYTEWKTEQDGLKEALQVGAREETKVDVSHNVSAENPPEVTSYNAMGDWGMP